MDPLIIVWIVAGFVVGVIVALAMGAVMGRSLLGSAKRDAAQIKTDAEREAASIVKEANTGIKEKGIQLREELEREKKELRKEIGAQERRVHQREETVEKRVEAVEQRDQILQHVVAKRPLVQKTPHARMRRHNCAILLQRHTQSCRVNKQRVDVGSRMLRTSVHNDHDAEFGRAAPVGPDLDEPVLLDGELVDGGALPGIL